MTFFKSTLPLCIILVFMTTMNNEAVSQRSYEPYSKIFTSSSQQWLCKELQNDYPDYFARPHPEIAHPFEGSLAVLGIEIPRELVPQLDALFFPENSNRIFLSLKSLADLYFPLFEKKLVKAGLPREYKFLPLVLSGLNQHAELPGGKAGLWALDFTEARREHLRVDGRIDERKGADFTTDAAIARLLELNNAFAGDHLKTITAFSRGMLYMTQNHFSEKPISWNDLDEESKSFAEIFVYATLLFDSISTENQLQHYFDILGNFESVFLEKDISLDAMKEVLGVDLDQFHQVNPVYIGNIIEGTYRKVPFVVSPEAAAVLPSVKENLYQWKPKEMNTTTELWTKENTEYRVRKGDSLGEIAERFNVSVKQLREWNGIKKDRIYEGQKLLIQKKTRKISAREEPHVPDGKSSSESPSLDAPFSQEQVIHHHVKYGESLWLIAKKYPGTTPEMIMKWNKCSELIQPGQVLDIHIRHDEP